MSVYVYDMAGEAIAFRRAWNDPYLFDLDGYWIGHCAWGDNDVADLSGQYLGSLVNDRLVRRNNWCERACHSVASNPGPVTRTSSPQAPLPFPNRFAYEDARVSHLT